MMSMPGVGELVIIFAVLFLLFGAKKLPALGGAIGESIKNFKQGIKESNIEDQETSKQLSSEPETKIS